MAGWGERRGDIGILEVFPIHDDNLPPGMF
jgi:hypothetical protein